MRIVAALAALTLLLICVVNIDTVDAKVSPMPYRPGYGLGSWIPPGVIKGMKKEGYARSAILLSEQMQAAAESLTRELKMLEAPTKNPLNSQSDTSNGGKDGAVSSGSLAKAQEMRTRATAAKVKAYDHLFDSLAAQSDQLLAAATSGEASDEVFSSFASSVESPVKWGSSKIESVDRAFDSITTTSLYLSTNDIMQFTTGSSSNESISAKAGSSTSGGFREALVNKVNQAVMQKTDNSASVGAEVAQTLEETYSVSAVDSTLILISFATHRKVKQFTNLVVDPDKLREAWNYFQPDKIPHPIYGLSSFAAEFNKAVADTSANNTIGIVSEVYLGSILVGMVHFLKVDRFSATSQTSSNSATSRLDLSEQLSFNQWVDTQTMSTAGTAAASHMAQSTSKSSTVDVSFDLMCLGYIPKLAGQKFSTTVTSIVGSMDPGTKAKSAEGAGGQAQQQSNAGSVVASLLTTVNQIEETNEVLGLKSFMDAFTDFSDAAATRPDSIGAPVGLNIKQFSKVDVMASLSQLYYGKASFSGGASSSSSADSGATPKPADSGTPPAE